jgi:hypothetical protein
MLDLGMRLASTMHILMEKVVKQMQKEHYSSFHKCLPICGLMFGFEFMLQVALEHELRVKDVHLNAPNVDCKTHE